MTVQGSGGQLVAAGSRASSSPVAEHGEGKGCGGEEKGCGGQENDFAALEVNGSTLAANGVRGGGCRCGTFFNFHGGSAMSWLA